MAFSAVTERGSAALKNADAFLNVQPSAALTVGKVVFAVLAFDNIATADGASTTNDTLTDTDGHTWTKVAERTNSAGAANDGVTGALWWTKVTSEIGTGDTVTFNVDSTTSAKVIGLFEVTVGAGNTIQLAAGGSTFLEEQLANASALTLSGLASKEYLFLGMWWREHTSASPGWTEDADYTNVYAAEGIGTSGSGATTNVMVNVGYRILTGTGDTFDVAGLTAVENAGALFAFEEVAEAGSQTLTGTLFTKAPTFPTGAITATYNLAGVLFTKASTFFTGAVTASYNLAGVLFTKAPTFPTGAVSLAAGPQTLTGSLFAKAPTFSTGVLTAQYSLTGSLFVKAPTFFTGTVTSGTVTLTGTLFVKAPTFPQGAITTGAVSVTGVLFAKAPTFPTGIVTAGVVTLTGSLFTKAPTFPIGTIGQAGTLFGTPYVNTPVFFTGIMGYLGGSFWRPNPAGYTLNPVAFVRVGAGDVPPWGIDILGQPFQKAPTFLVGAVS